MGVELHDGRRRRGFPAGAHRESLDKGNGIGRSPDAAFRWYLLSAKLGNKNAVSEVARCYYYGLGTKKNLKQYQIWSKREKATAIK
jgi:TPR repeat protein